MKSGTAPVAIALVAAIGSDSRGDKFKDGNSLGMRGTKVKDGKSGEGICGARKLKAWAAWCKRPGPPFHPSQGLAMNLDFQDDFPFNWVSLDISWLLATWFELLGAIALMVGLGTRFFSASLIILTLVAWASVHAGNGYKVCDNGYKLPLMYLVMFLPLLLSGPGKLSLDYWLGRHFPSR